VENIQNTAVCGEVKGIQFRYACSSPVRSASFLVRRFRALKGWVGCLAEIIRQSQNQKDAKILFLYTDSPWLCLTSSLLAKALRWTVVNEQCEWRPAVPGTLWTVKLFYKFGRYWVCDGVVCISSWIQEHVARSWPGGKRIRQLKLPIMADFSEFEPRLEHRDSEPCLVWCGDVSSYLESVLGLVRSFAVAADGIPMAKLLIAGASSPRRRAEVLDCAKSSGLAEGQVVLLGSVRRESLPALYARARALLAPLEDDDRSAARFPTKIAEYLASGRPVITSRVGDIPRYFTDGQNGYIAAPGDDADMASKMALVLSDGAAASRVGAAGLQTGRQFFHYANHSRRLKEFFESL
jgi:glycosyltransferase involved in cell wall biosynthesis